MPTVAITGEADGVCVVSAYLASRITGTAAGVATVAGALGTRLALTGQANGVAAATGSLGSSGGLQYPMNLERIPTLDAVIAYFPLASTVKLMVEIDTDPVFITAPVTNYVDINAGNAGIVIAKLTSGPLTSGTRYYLKFGEYDGANWIYWNIVTSFIPDTTTPPGLGGEEIFWSVGAGSGPPDLWATVPGRAVPGGDVTLFGHGFGDTAGSVALSAPSPEAMTVVSWSRIAPTSNAYTSDRVIDLIKGTSDAEHYEVVVTVPSDAAGPGGQIILTSA